MIVGTARRSKRKQRSHARRTLRDLAFALVLCGLIATVFAALYLLAALASDGVPPVLKTL